MAIQVTSLRYDDLCTNLNIDRTTRSGAWAAFVRITEKFTLEGDELQWLVCSLYDYWRREEQYKPRRGNCISLTRLLRCAKDRVHYTFPRLRLMKADEPEAEKWKCVLSQFFTTLRNWTEMVAGDDEERLDALVHVDRLERVFSVSTVVFKKLKSMFETVFAPMEPVQKRIIKRRRLTQCTTRELFAFCWSVYVLVKGTYPAIGDDLVNSFHLLICCVDWLFADALVGHRSDLLNPRFPLLPDDFSEDTNIDPDRHCIVEYLCEHYDGVVMEARIIKLYWWRLAIDKLVRRKVLQGDGELAEGVLELGNFHANLGSVNIAYEQHVMTVGDFDERVFLGENKGKLATSIVKMETDYDEVDAMVEVVSSPGNRRVSASELLQRTSPLPWATESQEKSPSSKNLSKMLGLLHDCKPEPSEDLIQILKTVASESDLKLNLESRVKNLSELATETFISGQISSESNPIRKVELTVTLYYRLLGSILTTEKERLKGKTAYIKQLLETDVFHLSLFACCTELVLFSHHSHTEFPRSLKALTISPFNFYKIIEVVVRCENGLWRAAVKHLNSLEENVLESLAWEEDSSLWQQLADDAHGVPTCEQVTYPAQLEKDQKNPSSKSPESLCPEQNPAGSTKRRLFTSNLPSGGLPTGGLPPGGLVTAKLSEKGNSQNSESENKTFTFQTAMSDDGRPILIPVQLVPIKKTAEVPQRKGQLGIFFRKVYHLASVRLREFCERLQIDENLRGKIWTCLEYCMVKNVDLLKGRHLDQILLCSIYIVCKLSEDNFIQFQELITSYRWQPHAKSATYREILLSSDQDSVENNRGDLVDFYNKLYVPKMKKFAMKFSYKVADQCPPISRLPLQTAGKKSPRKISRGHSVYLKSPIKDDSQESLTRPYNKMRYNFDNSSSRDLRRINRMIVEIAKAEQRLGRKRPLADENGNEVDENKAPVAKQARDVASSSGAAPPGLAGLAAIPALQQKLLALLSDRSRKEAI